jgi:hypothetical protein
MGSTSVDSKEAKTVLGTESAHFPNRGGKF